MSETIGVNVLQRAENLEVSNQLDGYSGVRIYVGQDDDGNDIVYEAGNTAGNVLEFRNPFGSQTMANNILADIQGYQYQPLTATAALLDPAAELGDGVTVNGVYSGLFTRQTTFGRLMASDIAAPTNEEIEHEFAVESPSDRQYTRFVKQMKATLSITNQAITAEVEARESADATINAQLSIQATQIAAKVSQTGGNSSSFGWTLTSTAHTWYANNRQVMKVNSSGLEVTGKITATSGQIGGFTIGSSSIYSNGMSSMSSGQTTGVHLGTDGIKLGQNFSVDTSGNVTANNMSVTGTLRVGGHYISAQNLYTGASQAASNYGSWNSAATSTSAGGYCYTGAQNGNTAKETWDSAMNAGVGVSYIRATTGNFGTLMVGGSVIRTSTFYVSRTSGGENTQPVTVLIPSAY